LHLALNKVILNVKISYTSLYFTWDSTVFTKNKLGFWCITFHFFVQYSKRCKGLKLPGILEIEKQKLPHQTELVLVVTLDGNILISAILGQTLNF